MPRQYLMTYNATQARWFKKHNKKQYAVSCKELGTAPTKEASWKAANEWWQAKLAQLRTAAPVPTLYDRVARYYAETGQQDDAARIQEIGDRLKTGVEVNLATHPLRSISESGKVVWMDRLARHEASTQQGATIAAAVDDFLTQKRAQVAVKISAGRWDNLRRHLHDLRDTIGPQTEASAVNEKTLVDYYTVLLQRVKGKDYSREYAKDCLQAAKQFAKWLWRNRLIAELPRNIEDNDLTITIKTKAIKINGLDEIKAILAKATGRLRLWVLLCLNCGYTQKDISDLKIGEVDWKHGTITRKRSKTSDFENVPRVTYPLWQETFALLKKYGRQHGKPEDRVLVNEHGHPLWTRELRGEKHVKVDCIGVSYYNWCVNEKLPSRSLRLLRKSGASKLNSHETYGRLSDLYQGHAPRTISDKHYADVPQKLFEQAIYWLGQQYGIT